MHFVQVIFQPDVAIDAFSQRRIGFTEVPKTILIAPPTAVGRIKRQKKCTNTLWVHYNFNNNLETETP